MYSYDKSISIATLLISLTVYAGATVFAGSNNPAKDGGKSAKTSPMGEGLQSPLQPPTLKFFQGSLKAVDPLNPAATPIVVDADTSPSQFSTTAIAIGPGEYNPSTGVVSIGGVARVFYSRTDGTLWQVGTNRLAAAGGIRAPVPQKVSSESEATELCRSHFNSVFNGVTNTRVAYEIPGADGMCFTHGDNEWRLVNLAMNGSQPPQDFPGEAIVPLTNPLNGAYAGWLALQGRMLTRVSPDLSTVTPLIAYGNHVRGLLGSVNRTGHVFLSIDGGLHVFNLKARGSTALSDTGYGFPSAGGFNTGLPQAYTSDGTRLYFVVPTSKSGAALMSVDGAGNLRTLHEPNDAVSPQPGFAGIALAGNRIAYSYSTNASLPGKVVSLAKDGTGLRILDSGLPAFLPSALGVYPVATSNHVFYTSAAAPTAVTAHAARADGTGTPLGIPNARWISYKAARNQLAFSLQTIPETMFALAGARTASDAAGARLLAVNALNPAGPRIELGEIPGGANTSFFSIPGFGRYRLGSITGPSNTGTGQSDILFWDSQTPGSLRRITDTPGVSELPIPGF